MKLPDYIPYFAVGLRQPWASALFLKSSPCTSINFRPGTQQPNRFRGLVEQWVFVHADHSGTAQDRLRFDGLLRSGLMPYGVYDELPFGGLIGLVQIKAVYGAGEGVDDTNPWRNPEHDAVVVGAAVSLPELVPYSGAMGLWRMDVPRAPDQLRELQVVLAALRGEL